MAPSRGLRSQTSSRSEPSSTVASGHTIRRLASQSAKDTIVTRYPELRSSQNPFKERRTSFQPVPEFIYGIHRGVHFPCEPCFGSSQRWDNLFERDVPDY